PRFARKARPSVHLSRARPALPRFAVPAHCKVGRLVLLHIMESVEHHHSRRNRDFIIRGLSAFAITAKNSQGHVRHYAPAPFSPSINFCNSAGTSGVGRGCKFISPLRTEIILFCLPHTGSYLGKSIRLCAPRLSFLANAERVTASETVNMDFMSAHKCHPGLNIREPGMLKFL